MKKTEIDHLFRRYYADMYRRARALLYDEQESEDVVSDIFENLLHADILPPADDERQLKGYLLAAVRNESLKRIRLKSNRERLLGLYAQEKDEDDAEDKEERLQQLLAIARQRLSEQELHIFHMRFIEGMSYDAIGTKLGISRVAVWNISTTWSFRACING